MSHFCSTVHSPRNSNKYKLSLKYDLLFLHVLTCLYPACFLTHVPEDLELELRQFLTLRREVKFSFNTKLSGNETG